MMTLAVAGYRHKKPARLHRGQHKREFRFGCAEFGRRRMKRQDRFADLCIEAPVPQQNLIRCYHFLMKTSACGAPHATYLEQIGKIAVELDG